MLVCAKAINVYLYLYLLARLPALRNVVEYTIGVFKNCFQCFKISKYSLPLSMQVNIIYINIVYALTIVHNFININNLDNLGYFPKI
jgi:hypothetical protein